MSAKLSALLLTGATAAGLGLLGIVSVPIAQAQPPRPSVDFACPSVAGLDYLVDPDDSQAFYTCRNGKVRMHTECPTSSKVVLTSPPDCLPPDNADDYHP